MSPMEHAIIPSLLDCGHGPFETPPDDIMDGYVCFENPDGQAALSWETVTFNMDRNSPEPSRKRPKSSYGQITSDVRRP